MMAIFATWIGLAGCVHVPETGAERGAVEEYLAAQPGHCVRFPLDGNASRLGYRPSRAAEQRTWYEGENPRPITTLDEQARLRALEELGLLERRPEEDGPDFLGYAISEAGKPFANARGFCYGRFELVEITKVKDVPEGPCVAPPTRAVEYRYRLVGIPDWARSPQFLAAYPDASRGVERTIPGTLRKNAGRWSYDDLQGTPICVSRRK